jgi:hypothetical protein
MSHLFLQKRAPYRKFFGHKLFNHSKARVVNSGRLARWRFREMETRKYLNNALKEGEHGGILTQRLIAITLMATGAIMFPCRERLAELTPDRLAMRLFLSVGGTWVLIIVVFDYIATRAGKKGWTN